ncbi:VHS-domain-containing protein [Cystobasidium minutum MCA 4210]|uniref:VHS-domain-containing protein n=1 Tax=Cystobasidium minutum MCA 4210 TaxID=1397322 RepID=UPI0034CD3D02|eukprot:jgi/Rhomi1/88775/CE88774_919
MYGSSSRYPGSSVASGSGSGWGTESSSSSRHNDMYSQLHAFIDRACSPLLPEPDMALNLEIADVINAKKANTPREAAVEVLKHVNSRNTHESMLALSLLDTLVKNCGYPMHLQIATKDFLNELVRRFPERPPAFPPPPMNRILELIHEWKNTICVNSKHKEDLTNIRDMHRLLGYKGYRFRDFDRRVAAVLNTSDNLKSAEELEEEDREAQAAKLQELIRRGTPKDLAAAQELMKIMSGAEPGRKPDYAAQSAKELASIQHRILMLNEMLDNMKPTERFADGDAFDQIASRCRNAQPKIQKWISNAEENEDADTIDKLLLMNDLINNVLDRYKSFKKGDRTATAEINPAFAKNGSKSSKAAPKAAAAPNLIDFDEPAPASSTASNGGTTSGNPMDDDFGLGGLTIGGGSSSSVAAPTGSVSGSNGGGLLDGLDFGGSSSSPAPAPQQQSAFYQQYQPSQQPTVSWGNLTAQPGAARSASPMNPSMNMYSGQSNRTMAPSANKVASPTVAQQSQLRPSTPGAINLGMMGAVPPPSPLAQGQFRQLNTMSPSHQQQPQQQSNNQAPKMKDPFDDLLNL